ncbi:MAG: hypothetical protein ACLR3X_11500 [Intestinibacter bartlettii]
MGRINFEKLKSLLISLALALVCVSMVISTDVVEAASIRLNKTSITMYTGQTSTLKVSGTSKKLLGLLLTKSSDSFV